MIQTAVPLKTRIFDTGKIGFGVITDTPLKKGMCVGQYVGEIITLEKYSYRVKNDEHMYGYALKDSFVIDACNKGNFTRFINHSCKPNCFGQEWVVDGLPVVGIFAMEDIEAGAELTISYDLRLLSADDAPMICKCGEDQCKKQIGTKVCFFLFTIFMNFRT